MKVKELLESGVNVRDWMKKHVVDFDDELAEIDGGKVTYFDDCVLRNCSRIEVPFAHVDGDFDVTPGGNNKIESLENCPETVKKKFYIIEQPLKNLKHFPKEIGGMIAIDKCGLKSFDGMTPVNLEGNVVSLEQNSLTSLKGIHKLIPKASRIYLASNPIKESILGLILIEGLTSIDLGFNIPRDLEDAIRVVRKYLGKGHKGVIDASRELIDDDLEDYAEM